MIRSLFPIAVSLLCLLVASDGARGDATTRPAPPAGAAMHLFLLAGQSNMAGRGAVEEQDKVVDARVWTLNAAGEWAPAVDPIHFDKPKVAGVGLGRTFATRYADAHPGAVIGLIPCAVGGVSLDQWKPGGKLYVDAVGRATIAMKRGTIRGILWHQGESDAKPEKIASYPARLDALVARLRADLGADDAPLVVGQLGVFEPADAKNGARVPFNEMIAKYAADRANVACVTSEGLASVGDGTHFDAASLRELGRRYAAAFAKLEASALAPSSTSNKGAK